jgi:hypothetical protein
LKSSITALPESTSILLKFLPGLPWSALVAQIAYGHPPAIRVFPGLIVQVQEDILAQKPAPGILSGRLPFWAGFCASRLRAVDISQPDTDSITCRDSIVSLADYQVEGIPVNHMGYPAIDFIRRFTGQDRQDQGQQDQKDGIASHPLLQNATSLSFPLI